ncbi:hypothetical protein ZWY2020_056652 [Hordeum vulgare]|nr:hypothetical protein ZWY2020_056652 [Hordeum vulgare]
MTLSLDAHLSAAITSSSYGETVTAAPTPSSASSPPPVKDAAMPGAGSAPPHSPSTATSSVSGPARTTFLSHHEWLGHLANKGVEDLTLGNLPFSFDVLVQHPATLLRCGASLRRLYLGVWLFPFTTDLPRGPDVFPNLQELGLCHGITEECDLEYMLACNPKLETMALVSNYGYPTSVALAQPPLCSRHSLADEVAVSSPSTASLSTARTPVRLTGSSRST